MNPFDLINNLLGNPISKTSGQQVVDIAGQANSITRVQTVGKLVEMGAGAILAVGSLAFLFYLLMGGFNWITAGGDKGKVENARNMITQGIIGIAILASVFALYGLVLNFLGIKGINVGQNSSSNPNNPNPGGCTIGQQYNDGGAGGYCTGGGAAMVVCVAPGVGPSRLQYVHYEPFCCKTGSPVTGVQFQGPASCP